MIPSCLYLIFYIFRYDDDDDDDVGKLIPPSDFGVGCFRG